MKKTAYIVPIIALCLLLVPSCAFLNGVLDEYFEGQGFSEDAIHITVTPYDYSTYPGPSDYVTVSANSHPTIQWNVSGVSGISEYWIFVYSPVLYAEALTAAVLPDVCVVEDIAPSYSSTVFGDWPAGAYVWDDPVEQPLKYSGSYIFWVAACDEYNGWIGMGMAEVKVTGGIDPPSGTPLLK
jgi:hypothetical protein